MKSIFRIALLLIGSASTQAQENPGGKTHHFSLKDCLEYSYQHQDSMKNARLDITSARYRVKETIGIGLPQIDGTAQLQDFLKVPTSLLPGEFFGQPGTYIPVKFGVKYQSSLGLNVSQIIFDGSYLVGLKASSTYRELSERNYTRTRIVTQVAVTKAFYQVLVNAEQIKLVDANVNQLRQQLDETRKMNQQGFVEKIDVDRLSVLYNNLVTTRENTVRLLALGYQLLKFQMGMPVEENLVITDKIESVPLDTSMVSPSDSAAYRNRIEYALLETQKKLNVLNVARIRSQSIPKLTAFGDASYSYQNEKFSTLYDRRFPTTVVGLTLNVPIFSGLQRLNQIRQAKIEVEKSDNVLHLVKNGIMLQQDQYRVAYQNSIQTLNSQRSNMQLAAEVLRVSKVKYEQGVGASLEVTQAQTALQEAENNYIRALYDALINKVDLENAYGRIK